MTKRRIIFLLGVCASMALLAVQSRSATDSANRKITDLPDLERLQKMTEAERKKYLATRKKQRELEGRQRATESKKKLEEYRKRAKEMKQESDKEVKEAGGPGFLSAKRAIGVTEDEWKFIKPKLEKVRDMRNPERSTVGLSLTGPGSSREAPGQTKAASVSIWEWNVSWKDKVPTELTEAQKVADRLIQLVDGKNVAPGALCRTMDELRKARRQQAQNEKQLAEARAELGEGLTARQRAALVLLGWL